MERKASKLKPDEKKVLPMGLFPVCACDSGGGELLIDMKYIFLFFSLFTISVTFCQENLIRLNPIEGKGYVLLNNDANISYYEISYIERIYSTLEEYTTEVLESYNLIGDNYFKIGDNYLSQPNVFLKITAFKDNGSTVEEEVPINVNPPQVNGRTAKLLGFWSCTGSTYSYWIKFIEVLNSNTNQTIGTYMSVDPGLKVTKTNYFNNNINSGVITNYNNLNFNYQYFSETQFSNLLSQVNAIPTLHVGGINYMQYYGIPDLSYYPTNPIQFNPQVIKIQNSPSVTYKSSDGTVITSNYVYGIKKGLGPWSGSKINGCLQTDFTSIPLSAMNNQLSFAINIINTNNQSNPQNCNKPLLTCDQQVSPHSFVQIPVAREDIKVEVDSIVWPWELLEKINLVYDETYEAGWEQNYTELQINKLSGNSYQALDVLIEDLYDENGNKVNANLSLSKGLYQIGVVMSNGAYAYFISEVEGDIENNNTLSNHFTSTIFPVPVLDQSFNINVSATRDLIVEYRLFDFNMNLIHATTFDIAEGSSETLLIEPSENIPNGLLINQFIFEDGSQLSQLTSKSN